MKRSIWKGPFITPILHHTDPPTVHRSMTILPQLVGKRYLVHNGMTYKNILVSEEMVNRKFGEFAWTKKQSTAKKDAMKSNKQGKKK